MVLEKMGIDILDTSVFTNFTNNFIFHTVKESDFIDFDFVT